MPIYEYRCSACDHAFERLVRMGAVPSCPNCGAADPARCVSSPAPSGTTRAIVEAGRRAAAREGHFSHYGRAERGKLR